MFGILGGGSCTLSTVQVIEVFDFRQSEQNRRYCQVNQKMELLIRALEGKNRCRTVDILQGRDSKLYFYEIL